ncbi:MAG: SAM-dependent chlorinase/fluorinase [Nitrospirales bacterium]|nr:SAM-dependent chlorinase/fluorinase [Nitrospira sp.]MDR4502732.1 SAM-dependent chlorinase/fluorinase [Nitrospirales bacterium]
MASATSLITLLTDFGQRDYFVPSMKGVILGINSQARITDLSHDIAPQNIEQAAFYLKSCYHYFPDGTIHVVVVDPGVGSDRRALLVSTSRYFFLAPDNGVLSYIFEQELSVEVRVIENKQYRLDSEGATFDGRDLFSPAAAWLTKGQVPGSYGPLVHNYVTLPKTEPRMENGKLVGKILYIDRFGNLISNITPNDLETFRSVAKQEPATLRLGDLTITGIKTHYAEGALGLPESLINSNGQLEVFIRQGNAAERCECRVGQRIEVA